MYLADTHALVWFLTDDKRLGTTAREILESADRGEEIVGIPSIVLLELLHICEKQKYALPFDDVLRKFQRA